MKRAIRILTAFLSLGFCAVAAPTFVTPSMFDRKNGLSDAQYEYLWAQGRNPSINQAAAREWIFKASRYQNVTNWLDLCGKSNDFAKLSFRLQGENDALGETNKTLAATNRTLEAKCGQLAQYAKDVFADYTNQLAKAQSYSNLYAVASAAAAAANAKIADEIADLEAKAAKYEEYKTKYPLLKSVFSAMKTDAENRAAVLRALAEGN